MKTRILLVASCIICAAAMQAFAGGGGGGGRGAGGRGIISAEDRMAITNAVQTEMTKLRADLTAAQKAAVEAALAKDATDASIKAKVEAVNKIQTDIAMVQCKAVKKQVKFTDDQLTQMKDNVGNVGYTTLFNPIIGGGRGGFGGAGGAGGAGAGRGRRGGGGGAGGGN
jgi:hypothetical protein